jgi:hypothetical protein
MEGCIQQSPLVRIFWQELLPTNSVLFLEEIFRVLNPNNVILYPLGLEGVSQIPSSSCTLLVLSISQYIQGMPISCKSLKLWQQHMEANQNIDDWDLEEPELLV